MLKKVVVEATKVVSVLVALGCTLIRVDMDLVVDQRLQKREKSHYASWLQY